MMMRMKKVSALWLLALVMAVVLVASGPAAGVLDLSEPTAQAKKKHKKKKKKRPPAFNVVQCTGDPGVACHGTDFADYLISTDSGKLMLGKEGNDIYEGKGASDGLRDESATSSDYYLFKGPNSFGVDQLIECGGSSDTVDLSSTSFRLFDNVTITRQNLFGSTCPGATTSADDLILTGPEGTVQIIDHFSSYGKVENFNFANTS